MALAFRAAFLGRGFRIGTTKCTLFKISLDSLSHVQNNYDYKALYTLSTASRQTYSTLSGATRKRNVNKSETEQFEVKKTEDGKEIVYEGMLSLRVRNIKFFSLSTTFLALGVQPLIYMKAVMGGIATKWTIPTFAVLAAFAVATPVLLHYVTKRYIIQVLYDPVKDTYTAVTYNIFVKEKKVEFTPQDVTIPTILGMFTTCAIKGKPMFLDAEDFSEQKHYIRIMGYDKPLDLQGGTMKPKPKKIYKPDNV
ncbi:transmembrane protein 70 homolog, mitochondrial [Phymastichus coffea]|uniref:transmembrane protein 70 homolog, mitochondrial n=1 Tax=Phymastichus coffea TaxID=108790 RepID=UPI00273C2D20|nr:transmembrane protein 70 homolog, mitochondrial [Phymastichus coffea]